MCAVVKLAPDKGLSFQEMISHLKERGVSVLIHAERLEIVENLPLTNLVKVDKKGLREDIAGRVKGENER